MHWRFSRAAWRLLPGSLTAFVFAALLSLGALQPLEQLAYSILFQLRGGRAWDDRLVLIAIDDASIKQLGRFPWSRQQYVKLLNTLSAKEATAPSVVVIDLIWSESSPDDAKLAQAISRSSRVVLAQARDSTGLPLLPVPALQNAAIATGHILSRTDADGLTRVINLFDNNIPTLGLAAAQAYTLVQASVPLPTTPQPLWINWAGRAQTLQQYSFNDVIQGRVPAQAFQRKIVLVGLTAVGFDPLSTPFDRNPPVTGVYLNAAVVNNLLQQNALQPVSFTWSLLIFCLAGPGLSLLLSDRRESSQILISLGLSLSWGVASLWLFHLGYWVPVVLPLGLCSLTTLAISFNDRLRLATRLQLQVQQLWQRHRADLVTHLPDAIEGKDVHPYQKAGLLQSVTRMTALAELFARSQSTQAAIARNLSIGLLAADFDGVIWFCNPAAADWLQAEVGSQLSEYLVPNWISEDQWQADLQRLKQQTATKVREVRECQQDDRWFELQLEPLVYQLQSTSRDRADGFLVVLEDITPRKQVEATLHQQVAELQRVGQLKDDFLSTVSHELRSPMTNIKMAIEMLKISRSKEATDRYLQILQNECARETDLINDLLDLQRLEAGAQTYTPEAIDLSDWLPPILQSFSQRAETQQQSLQMDLPPQLPALISDQPSLERIVVELVNNACKYTPPDGAIKVSVNLTAQYFELSVDNSGAEIPAAELPRIFEKFYRVPQADPWKRGGTGLGLALVSKLVDCLGGKISVNSGSGHTTFTVQLPTVDEQPATTKRVTDAGTSSP
ncbi:CHASE2 domain-containing protein [Phormidium sp. FACHB-592]|uniref:histidine kinase n=1 Tax=Stenomitos frigidus AS-A4 TaxID=2933935 RepID=A0ABV0KJY1_9CYAN|nr:CHASE2 domain-containing protein [Phormidium sp. FACHB-592]MBD2072760.1 CHASE2 domain-containing protein [Phormidium sp. FACHB-592]